MVGGQKNIRIVVRDNKAAAASVTAILITSQCVEHQLFFDLFVMITIQPVRTLQIQNGFCCIRRYCVTVSLTKHSAESCISNLLPHVRICIYMGCSLFLESATSVCVCLCFRWVKAVPSIFMSGSPAALISSVQLCGYVLSPQHRKPSDRKH